MCISNTTLNISKFSGRATTRQDGFHPGPTVPGEELDALLDATYPPLQPWRVARLRYERFLADAAEERLPPGPEFDRTQRYCARLAYLLMRKFSARASTRYHRIDLRASRLFDLGVVGASSFRCLCSPFPKVGS